MQILLLCALSYYIFGNNYICITYLGNIPICLLVVDTHRKIELFPCVNYWTIFRFVFLLNEYYYIISAALKYYLKLAFTTFDHFTSGPKRLFLKSWRMHIFIITFFKYTSKYLFSIFCIYIYILGWFILAAVIFA